MLIVVYWVYMMILQNIPIVQLFLAGVFAIISTESTKWLFNIRESSIGIHSGNTGQLMKTRHATILYSAIIFISNLIAFVIYNNVHSKIMDSLSIKGFIVDIMIIIGGVILVWLYLKKNHYDRSD